MKIAYVLSTNPFEENGVNKKVKSQVHAWEMLGNEVQVFSILVHESERKKKQYLKARIYPRKKLFILPKEFKKDIKQFNPDIVYLRFEVFKPFQYSILKKFNVVTEINTDDLVEYKLLAEENIREKIRLMYHILTRWIILKYSKGIISVTHELLTVSYINRFRKPSFVVPNSINLEDYDVVTKKRNEIPQLVTMGTADYPWHGIDKIIELAKSTMGLLSFHIIGPDGLGYPKLNNVKFYGYLKQKDYETIISHCDIGISTLSLHRKKMNEANSLKLRDYLAYGLPSIIGYRDTAFLNEIPKWIFELPNIKSNISENKLEIIEFCKKMKNYVVEHDESRLFIDSAVIEKNRLSFMGSLIHLEN